MSTPRVFISYAHESAEHRGRVRNLAIQLRQEGVDAWIDQFVEDDPPYWPTWMVRQIEQADFVLCVVTETYLDRFDADGRLNSGKGVNWEGLVVTESSYANVPEAHRKFIAIAFTDADRRHVPNVLLGAGRTAYVLPRGYDSLYRRLTGQVRRIPDLGTVRHLPERDRAEPTKLHVRSRPPFVTTRFLNRERETRLLREEIDRDSPQPVLLIGRPGVGKTALVGRMLEFLEGQHSSVPVTFSYLPAGGSVPLSPDLIRAHLGERSSPPPVQTSEPHREILVIDQAEALFGGDCDWLSAEFGDYLLELARRPMFRLILVSRRQPSSRAVPPEQRSIIALRSGLPPTEAAQKLLEADNDGRLGLRDSRAAVDEFIRMADGNPRALELVVAALAEDPLLSPEALVSDLAGSADVAGQLLADTYRELDDIERWLVSVLAVAKSAIPVAVLHRLTGCPPELDELIRRLALKEVVKVDRIGRRVLLDAFDARYASQHLVESEDQEDIHLNIARAASAAVEGGELLGSEADTWAIGAVEHFLDATAIDDATRVLDRAQRQSLEPRGVYDQVIRLRRRLLGVHGESPTNRIALVRLLYLSGRIREARELIDACDNAFGSGPWSLHVAAWNTESGLVFGDSEAATAAMSRFRRALSGEASVATRARALTGAAQLARRRGHLAMSRCWLGRAVAELEHLGDDDPTNRQIHALALHQLGQAARFLREHRDSAAYVAQALRISEEAGDRGGIAYRLCLRAALRSDHFDLDDARTTLEFALGIYDEIGDDWGKAATALALASVDADAGEHDRAADYLAAAVEHAARTNNTRVTYVAHGVRLTIERRDGSLRPETRAFAAQAVGVLRASGFHLYAGRVQRELDLHDLVVAGRSETDPDPIASLLQLGRPLAAVLPPAGQLPAGLRQDSDALAGMATDRPRQEGDR